MCTHCILSTGLKSNHDQVCVCMCGEGGYEGVRVEGGWKSLTGIVVGENQLFGVWWVRGGEGDKNH